MAQTFGAPVGRPDGLKLMVEVGLEVASRGPTLPAFLGFPGRLQLLDGPLERVRGIAFTLRFQERTAAGRKLLVLGLGFFSGDFMAHAPSPCEHIALVEAQEFLATVTSAFTTRAPFQLVSPMLDVSWFARAVMSSAAVLPVAA